MSDEIKPDTCPYCGGRWDMLLACVAKCSDSQIHLRLIAAAVKAEELCATSS